MAASGTAEPVDQDGLYREPFLVVDPGMHTAAIKRLDVDSAGRFLVTGSDDKTIRVWSAEDGRLQRTIRVPAGPGNQGKIYAVAMSPDGGTIAAGGWIGRDVFNNHILLFERATGRHLGRISGLPHIVNHLAFSPDSGKLAVALWGANGVRLFDTQSLQAIAEDKDYGDHSYAIAFAPDGRIAATSYDGNIRLYGPGLAGKRTIVSPNGQRPRGIAFSPDGSRIVVGYDDTTKVTVLDPNTLNTLTRPDTNGIDNGNLFEVAWSADGKLLYAGGRWDRDGAMPLRAWWSAGEGPAQDYMLTHNTIMGLRAFADGRLALVAQDPRLLMMDRSGSVLWQVEPRTAEFWGQEDQLCISPDGALVRFGFERSGASPARFDLRQRRLDADPPPDATLAPAQITGLDIKAWNHTVHPALASKPLELERYEISRSLAISPDASSFLLGADWALRRFDAAGTLLWRVPAPGIVRSVNITADGRVAVAAYGDGTIRWHRMTDGGELLAFFPHRDGTRWVAWTPLGHYIASPGGEDLIQWQINHGLDQAPDVYTASRFRGQFYRPDVIDRVLAELDPQQALEAADRASGKRLTMIKSVAEETPPRVAIIDPADGDFVGKPAVSVAYTVEDRPGTEIRRVRLLLDGIVVGEAINLTIPASGTLAGELNVTLQVSATNPTLTLLAESAKGSSDPATVRIRRNASDDDFKPTLYVLAVGVSRFVNAPHLNLGFADADATAFARLLKQQERRLYRQVVVDPLVNEEATGEAILAGLERLERAMSDKDVAAVFVSTHGANDANGEFYLLPADVDLRDELRMRRTGVRYAELRDTLGRLSERGKTLVFLDACHSGNVIPGKRAGDSADIDRVAADLASAETGVIVFSSSTGKQFSMESEALGHGYFTQALLEAFEGKSNCPPPWLRVADLQTWLAQRVKKLSNGAQTPKTTVPFQEFYNWPVYHVATSAG